MTEVELEQKIDNLVDKVTTIHTVLLGVPGTENGGLFGVVNSNYVDTKENRVEITKVKRILYTLIGFLVGSGVISGTALGISSLVK